MVGSQHREEKMEQSINPKSRNQKDGSLRRIVQMKAAKIASHKQKGYGQFASEQGMC
jgi:hypothetical protein